MPPDSILSITNHYPFNSIEIHLSINFFLLLFLPIFSIFQGIKAVIAESFERIHRSNLVGMGIIPLQFLPGQNADTLNLTGKEVYNIEIPEVIKPGQNVKVSLNGGTTFEVILRFDTEVDLLFYKNDGILNYMIRKMLQ